MFQKILIGYDEPERGGEATALAETLRDPHTGTLVLTSVYPPAPLPVGRYVGPQDVELLREQAEELLLVARDALPDRDRVMIRAIPSDSAARVLSEVAEAEQADLVVVGSSRRSTLGRLLPGTTAERLLHDAPCPVAVAPRGYSGGDIRRIGVAYDGSPEADAALRAAESLALERSAALTVYCVVEPPSPAAGMIAAAPAECLARCHRARSRPPARSGRQRAAGHQARVAAASRRARGGDRGQSLRRGRPALRRLTRLRAAPPRAPRQRLRRTRARGGLPRRGDPAHCDRAASCADRRRGGERVMRAFPFRRRAKSPDPPADLTSCQSCGSGYVIPTDWAERDEAPGGSACAAGSAGRAERRSCPMPTAQRYDRRLQQGMDEIARALHRQEREQMARDAETFATALELDLLDADDFVR